MRALAALLFLVTAAHAQPLTRDQIAAAAKAARAKLKVDEAAVKACQTKFATALTPHDPEHTPATVFDAAECYRAAGALGIAIRTWMTIASEFPTTQQAALARRELGPAYESAGTFTEAAEWHHQYAKLYPADWGARGKLIRALCIYRQLGLPDKALLVEHDLTKNYREKFSVPTLCATVQPIAVPK